MILRTPWSLPPPPATSPDTPPPPQLGYVAPTGTSLAPALTHGPIVSHMQGVDPMVAVGSNFMIVTQDHHIEFRTAAGDPLHYNGTTKPIAFLSATHFFKGFIDPATDHCINKHLDLDPFFAAVKVLGFDDDLDDWQIDTNAHPNPKKSLLVNEFYDTRVIFDRKRKLFFILSAARNSKVDKTDDKRQWIKLSERHYFAFAVSNSEDPRDGFRQYMVTEPNTVDFPRIAVKEDNFIVAYASLAHAGKPVARVFSVPDMIAGKVPREFSYTKADTGGSSVIPVTQHGESGGYTLLVKRDKHSFTVLGFKGAPSPQMTTPPPLKSATFAVASDLEFRGDVVTQRDNMLYIATCERTSHFSANEKMGCRRVRVVRVPITFGNDIHVENDAAHGFSDQPIGNMDDAFSREFPAIAVTADGVVVLAYATVAANTPNRPPEAHYTVLQDGTVRGSVAFAKGNTQPIMKHGDPPMENTATPVSYYDNPGGNNVLDFTTAVVADDDRTVWFTHQVPIEHPAPGGANPTVMLTPTAGRKLYKFVLAAVKP